MRARVASRVRRAWRFLLPALVFAAIGPGGARGAPGSGGSAEPRYAVQLEGVGDSLAAALAGGSGATDRLWSRGDLERFASLLRDALVSMRRYDATVRLALVEGAGTAPGVARVSVSGSAAEAGTSSALGAVKSAGATVAVPHVRTVDPRAREAAEAAFARGTKGSAAPEAIVRGVTAVRDASVAEGRYASSVSVDSIVPRGAEVHVHLVLEPGPPVRFDALQIPGASATRPKSAASIAGLKAGATVTPELLAGARERLQASGLFTVVGEPRVVQAAEPGRATVVIPVEESNASHFAGAVGVAQGEGLTGTIDLGLGNIGGTGRAAGVRWAGLGDGRSLYALQYREPALLGQPIDASFALDADVADSLFSQTRWSLAFGGRLAPRARAGAAVTRSETIYSGIYRGSSATWAWKGSLGWEGLAPASNPRSGFSSSLEVETGSRAERYPGVPEAKRTLLSGRATVAGAASLGGSRVLYAGARAERVSLGSGEFPAEELRYLGGSDGLRGHRDRAFGGNRIVAATLEHRWITDVRGGRAFLFVDAGGHALDAPLSAGVPMPGASASLARTELSDGWDFGYGAGLQARMASGLMGLTLGLRPGAALREGTLHLRYASSW
ncbi:MAG TPA: BamA/TamA family outer membrane protein [Candidatus Eisenbacteria bacterium]|nr:BamA/TamA family outer membrane protein [Candidatus Eisenbacteria bacterium]